MVEHEGVRLVLHAGAHKTGTTTLQHVLDRHRGGLRGQGVYYPNQQPFFGGSSRAHHQLALALTGCDKSRLTSARRFLDHVAAEGRASTVVLSAESFHRHLAGVDAWVHPQYWQRRHDYLATVAKALAHFSVTVVLVLRRQDEYAESLYKELVLKGDFDGTFERFVNDWAVLFDHSRHVESFETAFDDVVILSYHDGAVVHRVFDIVGVNPPEGAAEVWERRSVDARVVQWVRSQQGRLDSSRAFARSAAAAGSVQDPGHVGLWRSVAQRDAFLSSFDGRFAPAFFPPPPPQVPPLAVLTARDRKRLDRAFLWWRTGDRLARATSRAMTSIRSAHSRGARARAR